MKQWIAASLVAVFLGAPTAQAVEWEPISYTPREQTPAYREAIRNTASMVNDPQALSLAQSYGYNIVNLTWEDTGRYKNSAVGPNISDMTIQVGVEDPQTKQTQTTLMPVIRVPNFSDKTADLDPRDFTLLVGNEHGRNLKRVSLFDFLKDPTVYLAKPQSWRNPNKSLLAPRDSKVLVSAQAAFLPVPKNGKATFNPVVFNYQSVSGDPAVLTILATREGTSVTVIDNKRDGFSAGASWGQRLFHNKDGERASLTGERMSDFVSREGDSSPASKQGMSMVLLIQVPLKQKHPMAAGGLSSAFDQLCIGCGKAQKSAPASAASEVEVAVIGHGTVEGPFTEIDNLNIERDPRFPVRVTVQFYKATASGIVNADDMKAIHEEIDRVYKHGDAVGSLVTGGETGRVTEYQGSKIQPADWWEQFWMRHTDNTGESRAQAAQRLQALLGPRYQDRPVSDLYLRNLLRS